MRVDVATPLLPALSLRGVTKSFGGLVAVDDLTLDVPSDGVFGFVGPNGAGKTTLLNLISGFAAPDQGEILAFGERIHGLSPHKVARSRLARTYQNVRLFDGLTVRENIAVGAHQHRTKGPLAAVLAAPAERRERAEIDQEVTRLIGVVGLDPQCAGKPAESLSYGDQRRCEIARALATRPRVLLLDEPAAGMNGKETSSLANLLARLGQEGVTVVLIEHNMEMILRVCDAIGVMVFGRLVAHGAPRDCLAREDVREAYFGSAADSERVQGLLGLREGSGAAGH